MKMAILGFGRLKQNSIKPQVGASFRFEFRRPTESVDVPEAGRNISNRDPRMQHARYVQLAYTPESYTLSRWLFTRPISKGLSIEDFRN